MTDYLIRKPPTGIHDRLLLEMEARGVSSIPNLIRLLVSEALKIEWPASKRGNRGANKGKAINQPKGRPRKRKRKKHK